MADETAPEAGTPILPAHIEGTIAAIAKLHADHRQETGTVQRVVEQVTAWIGQPRFIAVMTMAIVVWIAGNLAADPQAVLDAIKETEDPSLSTELMTDPRDDDLLVINNVRAASLKESHNMLSEHGTL